MDPDSSAGFSDPGSNLDQLATQGFHLQLLPRGSPTGNPVVSNTGDAGYSVAETDARGRAAPSPSFPGKLLDLLSWRYSRNGRPLTILPCELVARNGEVLRRTVLSLASRGGLGDAFVQWLEEDVIWACSLVDRMVPESIHPAGAIAEPYALWAIESQPGLTLPCQHPAVQMVDSLDRLERLKLHILNLAHTVLAHYWLRQEQAEDQTVGQILREDSARSRLERILDREVLPAFEARGWGGQAQQYWSTARDRLRNAYLRHRLGDIAAHHREKVKCRISAFLDWSQEAGDRTQKPLLSRISREVERG